MKQLSFFEKDRVEELVDELQRVKDSNDKMRKALFARHGELAKHYIDLLSRLEILEKNICHAGTQN